MFSIVVSIPLSSFVDDAPAAHVLQCEVTNEGGRYFIDGGIDIYEGEELLEVVGRRTDLYGRARDALVEEAVRRWSAAPDDAAEAADHAYDRARELADEAADSRRGEAHDRWTDGPGGSW